MVPDLSGITVISIYDTNTCSIIFTPVGLAQRHCAPQHYQETNIVAALRLVSLYPYKNRFFQIIGYLKVGSRHVEGCTVVSGFIVPHHPP